VPTDVAVGYRVPHPLSLRRAPRDLNDGERRTVRELTELISEGRANLMGLIRQEVLSGIRSPAQFENFVRFFALSST
jgi:hypothetical protein